LDTMCRDLWNWQTKNPEGYAVTTDSFGNVSGGWNQGSLSRGPEVSAPPAANNQAQTLVDSQNEASPAAQSSVQVAAPVIPAPEAIYDPSTPAHLTPRAFNDPTGLSGLSTLSSLSLGPSAREIRPEDVFIGDIVDGRSHT